MARATTDLSGILLIDKEPGMTSHDVVNRVRKITGERRVGHAGTLDPAATGLLVILVGPATRLAPYLTGADKKYLARIVFGTETSTDDAEGDVTRTAPVLEELGEEDVATVKVAELVGEDLQTPPAYSAIKKDGKTAHKEARAGREMELEPRTIQITDAQLLGAEPGPPIAWNFTVTVSKGTYVRALARDLGRDLATAAHLGLLRRLRSGPLDIDDAHTLDELAASTEVADLFTPAAQALGMPIVPVDGPTAERVANGTSLEPEGPVAALVPDQLFAITHQDRLLAVYCREVDAIRAATVIPGGVT